MTPPELCKIKAIIIYGLMSPKKNILLAAVVFYARTTRVNERAT